MYIADVDVVNINCTDVDEGDNGKIATALASDLDGKCFLNANKLYSSKGQIDYESLKGQHFSLHLEVIVSDTPVSGAVMSSKINVLVKVSWGDVRGYGG